MLVYQMHKSANTMILLEVNKDKITLDLKISIQMRYLDKCFKVKDQMNCLDTHLPVKEWEADAVESIQWLICFKE